MKFSQLFPTLSFRMAPAQVIDLGEHRIPDRIYTPEQPVEVRAWDPDRGVFIIGELLDD